MSVGSSLAIDRLAQLEILLNGLRTEVEELLNLLCNLAVAHLHATASVCVDVDVHRLSDADGVAHLHEHLVGNACRYHVLCNVTCCVCCRAVYLRGVFAREGSAAVCALAAVCVDDDLATGEASVAVRAADYELASRVDEVLDVVAEECEHLLAVYLCLDARHEYVEHVVLDFGEHALVVGVKLVVLCRHYDGVDALRYAILRVFNGDLALRVGAQVCHLLALLAYVGEHAHDELCEVERYGHVVLGLVGGVAEHHSLVAGALVLFLLAAHTTVDVVRLLVDGCKNTA